MGDRIALSLKPDFDLGQWHWSLAGEGFSETGAVPARNREDAVLCVLATAHEALSARGPVDVVVSLPPTARLWAYADEVADHFAGVTLVPYEPADELLRAAAMKALNLAIAPPAPPAPPVASGPLTVATDGSAARGRIGWGWLAEDGRHDCGTAKPSVRSCARRGLAPYAELRAISEAIASLPGRDLVIRTDCRPAIDLVLDWIGGGSRVPDGYDVTHHTAATRGGLVWMQEQVRREAHRIDIGWVRGHAGDPLNEGADSLAKLGRRASEGTWGYTHDDVPARAQAIAAAFATDHPRQSAAAA